MHNVLVQYYSDGSHEETFRNKLLKLYRSYCPWNNYKSELNEFQSRITN